MDRTLQRSLSVALTVCLLLLSGLMYPLTVPHAAHHAHHNAATHATVLCTWMCAAGQGLEGVAFSVQSPLGPVFLAGLAVIAGLGVAVWAVERHAGWDGLDSDARAEATGRFSEEASRVAGKSVTIRCDEAGAHVDASAVWGELHRIGEQVEQDLFHAPCICYYYSDVIGKIE